MNKLKTIILLLFACSNVMAQLNPASLHFNGTSTYVRIPNNSNYGFGTNELTIEAWIKLESTQPQFQFRPILCNLVGPEGIFLALGSNRCVLFSCGQNGVQGCIPGSTRFDDGNCHHVAVTVSNLGEMFIYVDGALIANSFFTQPPIGNPGDLYIGQTTTYTPTDHFEGLIKEVRMWQVPRSQSQIQNSMNSVLTGTEIGLVGYWRMNETSGQTVTDYSSVHNNGTRGNTSAIETSDPKFENGCPACTAPSATITPAGATTFCNGGSVVLNAPAGVNRTYQWQKANNPIPGATQSSYTASTGGSYKVTVTNTNTQCAKTTTTGKVVTVNALPAANITPQGPTTFCAGGSVVLKANSGTGLTYQWKKGGANIGGATLLNYTATTGGNYKVQVTNSNGCTKISASTVVSVPCREDGGAVISEGLSVFPNPASGVFTISGDREIQQLVITDISGNIVFEKYMMQQSSTAVEIDLSNATKGIYLIQAVTANEVYNSKIVLN